MSTAKTPLALVFDFDGVLALSEAAHLRAWHDVGLECGRALPEGIGQACVGVPDSAIAGALSRHWDCAITEAELLAIKRRHCSRRGPSETRPVPGAFEAAATWSARYPVGLATSSRREDIEPMLKQENALRHFGSVLTIEDVENPKPSPEVYLRSAQQLGVAPEDCWVFEDSRAGVSAALAAGCRVIGLLTSHAARDLDGAEACFPDFRERQLIERFVLRQTAHRRWLGRSEGHWRGAKAGAIKIGADLGIN